MSNNSLIDDIIANDPDIWESFINESRESLVVAEKDLKWFRDNPGDAEPDRIERAFRAIHSLKSAAGFLGLDNVSNLALHLEEMLGHLRSGAIVPEINRVELLLEGVRILNDMLANPTASSNIDSGPFLAKLAEHLATYS